VAGTLTLSGAGEARNPAYTPEYGPIPLPGPHRPRELRRMSDGFPPLSFLGKQGVS
jgi:hypothetical protein